jgi:DnaK suppressor protein
MPAPDDDLDLDLDAIRAELQQRRDATRHRVGKLAERPERGTAQGFGKRIGDGTVEAVSRLTEIGVGRNLETTSERVARALAKLEGGTYGICDTCGEPIPVKRLEFAPESVQCVRCAAAASR